MSFVPFASSATSLSKPTFFLLLLLTIAQVPHIRAQGFSHRLTLRCDCEQSSPFVSFSMGFIPPQQCSAFMALKAVISLISLIISIVLWFSFCHSLAKYQNNCCLRQGSHQAGVEVANTLAEASRCGESNTKTTPSGPGLRFSEELRTDAPVFVFSQKFNL